MKEKTNFLLNTKCRKHHSVLEEFEIQYNAACWCMLDPKSEYIGFLTSKSNQLNCSLENNSKAIFADFPRGSTGIRRVVISKIENRYWNRVDLCLLNWNCRFNYWIRDQKRVSGHGKWFNKDKKLRIWKKEDLIKNGSFVLDQFV